MVSNQVAVIIKTFTDITHIIPDALGGDHSLSRVNWITVCQWLPVRTNGTPADHALDGIEIFRRHLGGCVGPDLIGRSRYFVAHGEVTTGNSRPNNIGSGPDIIIKGNIIIRFNTTGDTGFTGRVVRHPGGAI